MIGCDDPSHVDDCFRLASRYLFARMIVGTVMGGLSGALATLLVDGSFIRGAILGGISGAAAGSRVASALVERVSQQPSYHLLSDALAGLLAGFAAAAAITTWSNDGLSLTDPIFPVVVVAAVVPSVAATARCLPL